MDRDREDLRDEAFQMDEESQAWLAHELAENLRHSKVHQAWMLEIDKRLNEYRSGEGTSVSREEVFARARNRIAAANRNK